MARNESPHYCVEQLCIDTLVRAVSQVEAMRARFSGGQRWVELTAEAAKFNF